MSGLLCLLLLNFPCIQSQTIASSGDNTLKISKINTEGSDAAFTLMDALKLTRFLMAQEGIKTCESNLEKNTFLIETKSGVGIHEILLAPSVNQEMATLGFLFEYGNMPLGMSSPADMPIGGPEQADVKDPNCGVCKDVKVSEDLLKGFTNDTQFGGEQIIIDLNSSGSSSSGWGDGGGSSSSGGWEGDYNTDDYQYDLKDNKKLNLDSLKKAINGPNF